MNWLKKIHQWPWGGPARHGPPPGEFSPEARCDACAEAKLARSLDPDVAASKMVADLTRSAEMRLSSKIFCPGDDGAFAYGRVGSASKDQPSILCGKMDGLLGQQVGNVFGSYRDPRAQCACILYKSGQKRRRIRDDFRQCLKIRRDYINPVFRQSRSCGGRLSGCDPLGDNDEGMIDAKPRFARRTFSARKQMPVPSQYIMPDLSPLPSFAAAIAKWLIKRAAGTGEIVFRTTCV